MTEPYTPLPWKWHPRSEEADHNGSIYSEQRPGHAYAVAMMPRYASASQWKRDAEFIIRSVNALPDLVKTLQDARLQIEYLHYKFPQTGTSAAVLAQIDAALAKVKQP